MNEYIHQAGSGLGNPIVSDVPHEGDSIISVSGLIPNEKGVYLKGDSITFGNIETDDAIKSVVLTFGGDSVLDSLMIFIVQKDVNSDINGKAIIPIYPEIKFKNIEAPRNINQNIKINTPVNLIGAGTKYIIRSIF